MVEKNAALACFEFAPNTRDANGHAVGCGIFQEVQGESRKVLYHWTIEFQAPAMRPYLHPVPRAELDFAIYIRVRHALDIDAVSRDVLAIKNDALTNLGFPSRWVGAGYDGALLPFQEDKHVTV
ncbi:hypothetical protein D3C76_972900 [compost metagenome]